MAVSMSTALSGLSAAQERLRASAHNTANLQTQDFRPERVVLATSESGDVQAEVERGRETQVSAERELVEQRSATYTYVANLRVLETQLRAQGSLLDIKA